MCIKRYEPTEMLPYGSFDRETALRLAAQERFEMMMSRNHRNENGRRSAK